MTPRTTIAGAAAIIATRATIAFATTISGTATGLATWAEVAKLAGEFGVERIVEADGNRTVTSRDRLSSANGGRRSCSSR